MPRVGFEPTIPVFERAKTVHALDGATTVIGRQRWVNNIKIGLKEILYDYVKNFNVNEIPNFERAQDRLE
jgi:hypothetical protein